MTTRTLLPHAPRSADEAIVWIDHQHAVIVTAGAEGTDEVELLERDVDETAHRFEGRAVDQVLDEPRIVVSGPAFARTSFERAYVAVTHRPDRLVDVAPMIPAEAVSRATPRG
jgi:hypothetical protein